MSCKTSCVDIETSPEGAAACACGAVLLSCSQNQEQFSEWSWKQCFDLVQKGNLLATCGIRISSYVCVCSLSVAHSRCGWKAEFGISLSTSRAAFAPAFLSWDIMEDLFLAWGHTDLSKQQLVGDALTTPLWRGSHPFSLLFPRK